MIDANTNRPTWHKFDDGLGHLASWDHAGTGESDTACGRLFADSARAGDIFRGSDVCAACAAVEAPPGDRRLPELCLYAHMAVNGTSDPMRDDEAAIVLAHLRWRISHWAPSVIGKSSAFDSVVGSLVLATIAELEALRVSA